MRISELSEVKKQHMVWRLDHKTPMGILTAGRIVNGLEFGDLEVNEVFKRAGLSDRSAKIHAGKVERFNLNWPKAGNQFTRLGGRKDRVRNALEVAVGGIADGDHHKMWIIDQMVRALTGCSTVEAEGRNPSTGKTFTYLKMGKSKEYLKWVADYENGEEGPRTYEWDTGVPP